MCLIYFFFVQLVAEAKLWVSEVKDALHGPARRDQATTLVQLRRLLKQGEDSLRIIPVTELMAYRNVLAEAKLVGREARDIIAATSSYVSTYGLKSAPANDDGSDPIDMVEDEEEEGSELIAKKMGTSLNNNNSTSNSTGTSAGNSGGNSGGNAVIANTMIVHNSRSRTASTVVSSAPLEPIVKQFTMNELDCILRRFSCLPQAPVLHREASSLQNIHDEVL